MNENLGHSRTKETEVRIANISKGNETASLWGFDTDNWWKCRVLQQSSESGQSEDGIEAGNTHQETTLKMSTCLKWNHRTSLPSRRLPFISVAHSPCLNVPLKILLRMDQGPVCIMGRFCWLHLEASGFVGIYVYWHCLEKDKDEERDLKQQEKQGIPPRW